MKKSTAASESKRADGDAGVMLGSRAFNKNSARSSEVKGVLFRDA